MKVHDYSTHENIGTFKIVEPFKDIFLYDISRFLGLSRVFYVI